MRSSSSSPAAGLKSRRRIAGEPAVCEYTERERERGERERERERERVTETKRAVEPAWEAGGEGKRGKQRESEGRSGKAKESEVRERLREKKTCQAQRQRSSIRPVSQASGTMRRHALGLGSKGRVRLPELVLGPSSLWKCRSSRSNTSIAFRNPSTGVQLRELLQECRPRLRSSQKTGSPGLSFWESCVPKANRQVAFTITTVPSAPRYRQGIASTGNVKHSSRHE